MDTSLSFLRSSHTILEKHEVKMGPSRAGATEAITSTYATIEETDVTTRELNARLEADTQLLGDIVRMQESLSALNRSAEEEASQFRGFGKTSRLITIGGLTRSKHWRKRYD